MENVPENDPARKDLRMGYCKQLYRNKIIAIMECFTWTEQIVLYDIQRKFINNTYIGDDVHVSRYINLQQHKNNKISTVSNDWKLSNKCIKFTSNLLK